MCVFITAYSVSFLLCPSHTQRVEETEENYRSTNNIKRKKREKEREKRKGQRYEKREMKGLLGLHTHNISQIFALSKCTFYAFSIIKCNVI